MFARLSAAVLVVLVTAVSTARADQLYAVDGSDTFRIPGSAVVGDITYTGTGELRTERRGNQTRFTTRVSYRRTVDGTVSRVVGTYETTLADGVAHDGPDGDPDDLTILKQPFAVQLDAPTLRDLGALRSPIPFDFPSPIIGATLHGVLRRLPDALLNGRRVLGIAFSAHGPLHGQVPELTGTSVTGSIEMSGRAYYAYETALLLALDATLAIAGNLDGSTARQPVSLVYRRTIRPLGTAPAKP
jgi:hypothetical protein